MRLVPRQLRHSSFPSSVPYYGGRLTPQMTAGLGKPQPGAPAAGSRPAPRQPVPVPSGPQPLPDPADAGRQLAALEQLRDDGVLNEREYQDLRRRITGGS